MPKKRGKPSKAKPGPPKVSKLAEEKSESPKVSSSKTIISWGAISAVLLVAFDFIGRVVTGLDFLQYLSEWRSHILNYIVLGGSTLVLALGYVAWQLFRHKNHFRYIFLVGILSITAIILASWISYVQAREAKLIVL